MPKASSLLTTKPGPLATSYTYLNEGLASYSGQELGTVLQLIGDLKTGTKPTQYQRLQARLRKPRIRHPVNGPTRIVSIDMGIRNLAFCVLDVGRLNVNHQQHDSKGRHRKGEGVWSRDASLAEVVPRLPWALDHVEVVAWKRLSLLDALSGVTELNDLKTSGTGTAGAKTRQTKFRRALSKRALSQKGEEPVDAKISRSLVDDTSTDAEVSSTGDIGIGSPATPDYTPVNVAKMAYRLVKDILLPYNATQVLIERQRHRSGGAPAVQEWTVRVNMLESMLHAIFETFRHSGGLLQLLPSQHPSEQDMTASEPRLGADGQILPAVHSVNPAQANSLWLDPDLSSTLYRRYPSLFNNTIKDENREYEPNEAKFKNGLARTYKMDLTHRGKTKGAVTKARKIQIAELWARRYLAFSTDAQRSCDRFLAARGPVKNVSTRTGATTVEAKKEAAIEEYVDLLKKPTAYDRKEKQECEKLTPDDKKLDDLADCLLQGVAWVQWELNRQVLSQVLLAQEPSTTQKEALTNANHQPLSFGDLEAWPRSSSLIETDGRAKISASNETKAKNARAKTSSTTKRKPKVVAKRKTQDSR